MQVVATTSNIQLAFWIRVNDQRKTIVIYSIKRYCMKLSITSYFYIFMKKLKLSQFFICIVIVGLIYSWILKTLIWSFLGIGVGANVVSLHYDREAPRYIDLLFQENFPSCLNWLWIFDSLIILFQQKLTQLHNSSFRFWYFS